MFAAVGCLYFLRSEEMMQVRMVAGTDGAEALALGSVVARLLNGRLSSP